MKEFVIARTICMFALPVLAFLGCGGGGGGGDGVPAAPPPPPPVTLALAPFVSGFTAPVGIEAPSDGSGRFFVVQQAGTIRIVRNGTVSPGFFLDITALIESGGEKGLLGLAFHPDFVINRRFFVNYTRRVGLQLQTVISEFLVSPANPDLADLTTERQLMVVNQPFDNHNGGQLAFGPDGFLYIGLGDGGSGGDPSGNGQNLNTLLGKILRIDVDSVFTPGKQYAIPPDNPFITGGLPEIWAYGFRNPWKFSFDVPTGRLFVGDVGESTWEEVDLVTKGGDYGWNIMEGNHCFPPGSVCSTAGLTTPITEYGHDTAGGVAVLGGFLYRGTAIPSLTGAYVFGDLSSGHVWALNETSPGTWQRTLILTHAFTVSAFGRDTSGELYLLDYGGGTILRLAAGP
jgi:glucose/arabinose dehydrogenase